MLDLIKMKYDDFFYKFFSFEIFKEYIFYSAKGMKNYSKEIKIYKSFDLFLEKVLNYKLEPYFSDLNKYIQNTINEEIREIKRHEIKILYFKDKNYPERLRKIKNYPKFIFYKGDLSFYLKSVAIVGTRNADKSGEVLTKYFTDEMVRENIVIVSGSARGIDTYAQKEALSKGGRIVIVTGVGLGVFLNTYQGREYLKNSENILFLTEFPLFFRGNKQSFPIRNRIISGLSLATLIMQAPEKSGALYTAEYAIIQNKPLFVGTGEFFSDNFKGNLNLLKKCGRENNIYPLTDIRDILNKLNIKSFKKEKTLLFNDINLTESERKVLKYVKDIYPQGIHFDKLFEMNKNLGISEFQTILLNLLLKDFIDELEGKTYVYKS